MTLRSRAEEECHDKSMWKSDLDSVDNAFNLERAARRVPFRSPLTIASRDRLFGSRRNFVRPS